MYKVPIAKKYDVVIASCGGFPKDINLYQAQKGLDNASHAVKDDGTIVLVAECREGFGERTFEEWMRKAKSPDEPLQWIRSNFVLGGHKAVGFCRVLKKADIFLCSSMDENVVREIFMTPFIDPQRAIDAALEKHGKSASVLLMPYANSTLAMLE
jgi:nickel-dependent lactate racemase